MASARLHSTLARMIPESFAASGGKEGVRRVSISPRNLNLKGTTMAKKASAPHSNPDPDSDFDNMYGTRFLSGSDVKKPTRTTITAVDKEIFDRPDGRSEAKATLTFKDFTKAVVCNKTNAANLADSFGKDFTKWVGRTVLVKSEMTSFGGRPVRGLRIYPVDPNDMQGDAITY
jgi:hypothetical protein